MIEDQMSPERFAQLAPAIQEKILRARAAAERRAERREDREALKLWLRLQELQSIPVKQRSKDEHNEFQRLYRKSRSKNGGPSIAESVSEHVEESVKNAEQFWALNRLSVSAKLPAWREQESRVLDQIHWMTKGWACSPQDPDFVSLEEGLEDLEQFIAEYGLIHDDVYDSLLLKEHTPRWSIWDGFWRNPEVLRELCQESPATDIFCRFGIRVALSAYDVRTFKQRIAEHERAKLQPDVRRAHVELESSECWLCKAWEQQQAEQG